MLLSTSCHHDQLQDEVLGARVSDLPLGLLEPIIVLVLARGCGLAIRGRSCGIIWLNRRGGCHLGHVERLVCVRHRHLIVSRLQLKVIWLKEGILFHLTKHKELVTKKHLHISGRTQPGSYYPDGVSLL